MDHNDKYHQSRKNNHDTKYAQNHEIKHNPEAQQRYENGQYPDYQHNHEHNHDLKDGYGQENDQENDQENKHGQTHDHDHNYNHTLDNSESNNMITDKDNNEVISSDIIELSQHEYDDEPVGIFDYEINISENVNESQTSPEYFAYNVTDDQFLHDDTVDCHQE